VIGWQLLLWQRPPILDSVERMSFGFDGRCGEQAGDGSNLRSAHVASHPRHKKRPREPCKHRAAHECHEAFAATQQHMRLLLQLLQLLLLQLLLLRMPPSDCCASQCAWQDPSLPSEEQRHQANDQRSTCQLQPRVAKKQSGTKQRAKRKANATLPEIERQRGSPVRSFHPAAVHAKSASRGAKGEL
jgi:hypothetical protein